MKGLIQLTPGRALLALSGWIALAATLLPAASPERIAPTVVFLVFGPGAACVGLRRRLDSDTRSNAGSGRLEDFTLTFVVSLGLAAIVSEAFYLGHAFTTPRAMAALAAVTTVAALIPGAPSHREADAR